MHLEPEQPLSPYALDGSEDEVELPWPVVDPLRAEKEARALVPHREIVKLGSSVVHLEEVVLECEIIEGGEHKEDKEDEEDHQLGAAGISGKRKMSPEKTVDFKMKFYALATGLFRVGGLRIILLESGNDLGRDGSEVPSMGKRTGGPRKGRVVLELATVAEVWVHSLGSS